jgi:hypothetical protein
MSELEIELTEAEVSWGHESKIAWDRLEILQFFEF